MPIVMFYDDEPQFVLSGIKRGPDGRLESAHVVNGAWDLVVTETEHQAKNGHYIVNRWPAPTRVHEVEVPSSRGDYNDVISRAIEIYKARP